MSEQLLREAAARLAPEELAYVRARAASAQVVQVQESAAPDPEPEAASRPAAVRAAPARGGRRSRRRVQHTWPPEGTVLTAKYFGVEYRATIVPAQKRLRSGRQLRIDTGPAACKLCDSLSEAMVLATEQQRKQMNLGRKGVSNGWLFWKKLRA